MELKEFTLVEKSVESFSESTTTVCLPQNVIWFNRISLFVIFFWFGILKIFSSSPAETLVKHLHKLTIGHFIPIHAFLILLGTVECLIGLMWLIPRITKYVLIIFLVQMLSAFLPLILLTEETWSSLLVLTLSGQYIFKNVALIASAFTIYYDCTVRGWKMFK